MARRNVAHVDVTMGTTMRLVPTIQANLTLARCPSARHPVLGSRRALFFVGLFDMYHCKRAY